MDERDFIAMNKPKYLGKPRGGAGLGQGKKKKDSFRFSVKIDRETHEILQTKKNQTNFVERAVKLLHSIELSNGTLENL